MQNGITVMEEKIDKEKISNKINDLIKEINNLKKDYEKFINEDEVNNKKEYRAGEWVPSFGMIYWYYDAGAAVDWDIWQGDTIENVRLSSGNVFPTEAIAEAAKKHAEWWRAFDMADEGGKVSIWVWTTGGLHVLANNYKDSNPRWQSIESARAWVDSHGGEAYVSEMLTKGRVFKFTI